jgi:hypothetical protein
MKKRAKSGKNVLEKRQHVDFIERDQKSGSEESLPETRK